MPTQSVVQREVEVLIEELTRDRFYGSIELKMEAGKILIAKITKTVKFAQGAVV